LSALAVILIMHSTTGIYRLKSYTLVRKSNFTWGQATKDPTVGKPSSSTPLSLCNVHQQYLYERPVHIPHKIACVVLIRFVIPVVFNKLTRVERMYRWHKKRELLKCVVAATYSWPHCGTGTLSYRQPGHFSNHGSDLKRQIIMVQFLSIIFCCWISSIFVEFFKSSRFFVSHCTSLTKLYFMVYIYIYVNIVFTT